MEGQDGSRRFLTYMEYRRHCSLNGIVPEKRRDVGPFIDAGAILDRGKGGAADSSVGEVFSMLQEHGYLSRRTVDALAKKVSCDGGVLLGVFRVLGKEDVSEEELASLLAG